MSAGNEQFVAVGEDKSPTAIRPIGTYPLWKRGFAVVWVLFLCVASGFFGLFVASFFSISGY